MSNLVPILLVDDNDAFVSACAISLESSGFDVSQAYGGQEAVDQCAFRKFALAIVDLNMPELDGAATIGALLARTPTMKIIAISGGMLSPHFAKLAALGVRHFISKPFRLENLLADIRDLLDPIVRMELSGQAA